MVFDTDHHGMTSEVRKETAFCRRRSESVNVPKRQFRFSADQISWMCDWLTDWVIDWVRDFSPWASSVTEAATETKFGTKVAQGMRTMPNVAYMHSAEKARDTTLDDKKYDVRYRDRGRPIG